MTMNRSSMSLKLILILHVVLPFIFQSMIVQCARIHPEAGNDLIDETCKKTPDYNLCVSSLKSDPRSAKAKGPTDLALIIVDVTKDKSSQALNHINQLLRSPPPQQKQALSSCADKYNAVLKADIPEAIEALTLGNPKFAEQAENDAAFEANLCEKEFSGTVSPLTDENKAVHDVAAVGAAIVRLLL